MLNKKFEELSSFIQSIEESKPLEFFNDQLQQLEHETVDESQAFLKEMKLFNKDISQVISRFVHSRLPEEIVLIELYHMLLDKLKKKAIYEKASELGIEPSLFKKEMSFLFKGKA